MQVVQEMKFTFRVNCRLRSRLYRSSIRHGKIKYVPVLFMKSYSDSRSTFSLIISFIIRRWLVGKLAFRLLHSPQSQFGHVLPLPEIKPLIVSPLEFILN